MSYSFRFRPSDPAWPQYSEYQKLVEVKGEKSKMALSISIDNGYCKDMDLCPVIASG